MYVQQHIFSLWLYYYSSRDSYIPLRIYTILLLLLLERDPGLIAETHISWCIAVRTDAQQPATVVPACRSWQEPAVYIVDENWGWKSFPYITYRIYTIYLKRMLNEAYSQGQPAEKEEVWKTHQAPGWSIIPGAATAAHATSLSTHLCAVWRDRQSQGAPSYAEKKCSQKYSIIETCGCCSVSFSFLFISLSLVWCTAWCRNSSLFLFFLNIYRHDSCSRIVFYSKL